MAAKTVRSRPRRGIWLFFVLAAGLFVLVVLAGVLAYQYRYADRVYEGVRVAGIPLGGMSLEEATASIRDGLTPYPGNPITLQDGERSWALTPAELGVSVDVEKTGAAAFAVGRRGEQSGSSLGGLVSDLAVQWAALQFGRRVAPVLRYDEDAVARALQRIAREVDVPPREGKLTISGLEVSGANGYSGRRLNVEATRAALFELLRAGKGGSLDLAMEERLPSVADVSRAAAKATALVSRPLMVVTEGLDGTQRFAADRVTLRDWLTFTPSHSPTGDIQLDVALDREQVIAFLEGIAQNIDRPAGDATLDFDPATGKVVVLTPSQAGQKLEIEASADAITAALLGEDGSGAIEISKEITLPVTAVEPKVDSNKIDEMGIVELVSQGTTRFKGSSTERVHNIVTGAEKFRGVVIPPGEEFSFNEHVGEITAANGFAEGLIIGAERTAVGVGGGICQVSTTVFRAAFNGGFPITERYAHGYVVSWYGDPGLDATIFTPSVDFRFRNDTGHFLLVKPEVDTEAGEITFSLYGTRPDRVVESDPPVVTNKSEPPDPLYEENAALAPGEIKQVDWAKEGMDVLVVRRIKYGDGTESVQKFVSKYQPWQAVYQYGPGTDLSGGESGG
jgi:vancomycin resistance protein YoaR